MKMFTATYRHSIYKTEKSSLYEGESAYKVADSIPHELPSDDGFWELVRVM